MRRRTTRLAAAAALGLVLAGAPTSALAATVTSAEPPTARVVSQDVTAQDQGEGGSSGGWGLWGLLGLLGLAGLVPRGRGGTRPGGDQGPMR